MIRNAGKEQVFLLLLLFTVLFFLSLSCGCLQEKEPSHPLPNDSVVLLKYYHTSQVDLINGNCGSLLMDTHYPFGEDNGCDPLDNGSVDCYGNIFPMNNSTKIIISGARKASTWIEPVNSMPYSLNLVSLQDVYEDGTVSIKNTTSSFLIRPGDWCTSINITYDKCCDFQRKYLLPVEESDTIVRTTYTTKLFNEGIYKKENISLKGLRPQIKL